MTPLERARLQRRRIRLRTAQRGRLPEWPNEAVRLAQLSNKHNAEALMRAHDRKHPNRRAVEKAICIPAVADEAFRRKVRGFDAAEAYFRVWLELRQPKVKAADIIGLDRPLRSYLG